MVKRRGLALGKFAPLHKGHQLVIETALAEMDEVVAVIYDCPNTTSVPLGVRSGWLKKLYPRLEVIEAWDGPEEVGESGEIKRLHEEYIIGELRIEGITHFYSSEFYGEHMSRALSACNRLVDPPRKTVPVSGTRIRGNPYAFRAYLDPVVYRDLITTAVFLGAPSTGKSTLASRMADEYSTVYMPEHGREFWEKNQIDRRLTLDQLETLALEHLERENRLMNRARRFLFVDTNALTTLVFSKYYHGTASHGLQKLARESAARYDIVFLCETDIPHENTRDRSGEANRRVMQKRTREELICGKIPFFTLVGDLETRVRRVRTVLERFKKYMNIADFFPTP